jgi:hypothetical protein
MYAELYQYLLQYKKLPVPGIGTFLLEKKPAVADFPNKIIHAPSYQVVLTQSVEQPGSNFYQQLAQLLTISEREAVIRFNDFSFDFKDKIDKGSQISWSGMGVMAKGLDGAVRFTASAPLVTEMAVSADKVIRQKAEHTVRVGEDQKTAEEMTLLLNQPEKAKSYWWVWAAAVVLLGFLFLGWHFSSNGIDAIGVQQKLSPLDAAEGTYRILK